MYNRLGNRQMKWCNFSDELSCNYHNCQSHQSAANHSLPLQLPRPSNCWWRIPSWWILARQYPWCASPRVESLPLSSPGSAQMTACLRGAWWMEARSHCQLSPQMRRGCTAAWPATTWETQPRSPPPLWCEVRRHECMSRFMGPRHIQS